MTSLLDSIYIKKDYYRPIYTNGSLVLGQEYDGKAVKKDFDPGFDPLQSFSGKITQVEIWNMILRSDEIQNLANCRVPTLKQQNLVVNWNVDDWKLNGYTTVEDIPLNEICQKDIISNQLIWPREIDFETFSHYCNSIDGIPPFILTNSQKNEVYKDIKEIFITVNKTFPKAFFDKSKNSGIKCFPSKTKSDVDFWLGMKWNKVKEKWYSPFRPFMDLSKFKLSLISEDAKCSYIYANTLFSSPCERKFPCGICKIPDDTLIYLKGFCEQGYDIFDQQYYIYGLKNNRPYFK